MLNLHFLFTFIFLSLTQVLWFFIFHKVLSNQWQNVEMRNFIIEKVIMLNVTNNPFMLSVVMPGVIRLYALILSVEALLSLNDLHF